MSSVWPYTVPGIPDDEFIRGDVPMTKREVRALTICAAKLAAGLTVWDIGAGTGSLSVEAALFTPGGRVYAVEKNDAGCALIRANAQRFETGSLEVVPGEAPDVLADLPDPDRVFLGGSGGRIENIIESCATRLRPGGVLVANVIGPRNLVRLLDSMATVSFTEPHGVYLQASRLEKLGREEYFRAQNGIWIISAQKEVAS